MQELLLQELLPRVRELLLRVRVLLLRMRELLLRARVLLLRARVLLLRVREQVPSTPYMRVQHPRSSDAKCPLQRFFRPLRWGL